MGESNEDDERRHLEMCRKAVLRMIERYRLRRAAAMYARGYELASELATRSRAGPVPYLIWILSVEKWERGCACKDFRSAWDWWHREGDAPCSFCDFYHDGFDCGMCPLAPEDRNKLCAEEWYRIRLTFHALEPIERRRPFGAIHRRVAFFIFRRNARAMLARIRALPHTKPEKTA